MKIALFALFGVLAIALLLFGCVQPTVAPTPSPTPAVTPTPTPAAPPTPSPSPTLAVTPTPTPTPSPMLTAIPTLSPTPSPTQVLETSVSIQNFAFSPATLTIKKGTKVTWTNLDAAPHTATSTSAPAGGAFDSGALQQGQSWTKSFDVAGRYEYYCAIHTYMKAVVVVE